MTSDIIVVIKDLLVANNLQQASRELQRIFSSSREIWDFKFKKDCAYNDVVTFIGGISFSDSVSVARVNIANGNCFISPTFFINYVKSINDLLVLVTHQRNHILLRLAYTFVQPQVSPILQDVFEDMLVNSMTINRSQLKTTLFQKLEDANIWEALARCKWNKLKQALPRLVPKIEELQRNVSISFNTKYAAEVFEELVTDFRKEKKQREKEREEYEKELERLRHEQAERDKIENAVDVTDGREDDNEQEDPQDEEPEDKTVDEDTLKAMEELRRKIHESMFPEGFENDSEESDDLEETDEELDETEYRERMDAIAGFENKDMFSIKSEKADKQDNISLDKIDPFDVAKQNTAFDEDYEDEIEGSDKNEVQPKPDASDYQRVLLLTSPLVKVLPQSFDTQRISLNNLATIEALVDSIRENKAVVDDIQGNSLTPPAHIGKRDLFTMSLGYIPTMWEYHLPPAPQVPGRIYLDVSGSTESYWQLILTFGRWLSTFTEVVCFSTYLFKPVMNNPHYCDIKSGYGTDFRLVAKDIIENNVFDVFVVTDNQGSLSDDLKAQLFERNINLIAIGNFQAEDAWVDIARQIVKLKG